mmetsp:Transcript_16532/g.46670  ORF Transcript_16532/g.46670 Transcript_16532/m.46670 type:complete len:127 (-) Transcript_16532:39-419(-)|eukprot:CAMPEP_0119131556 /NCGR_PEP_ID=MMETSP1310-20130426/10449_1 /TAXON_ID=464262 /ORGANISM="Genus nov. species nov., Strain RCC2339" /LENGTH=126 /DNA_ID=CAMNT_0007122139 /DNA_START=183 /DNA_END=563 /DNA_ORIENTATION=-
MTVWVLSHRILKPGFEPALVYKSMYDLKARATYSPGFLAAHSLKKLISEGSTNHGIPVRSDEQDIEDQLDRRYTVLSQWSSILEWNRWLEDPVRVKIAKDMEDFMEEPERHVVYKLRKNDETPFLL